MEKEKNGTAMPADTLTQKDLARYLPNERCKTVICLDETDSTNRVLLDLCAQGAADGTVVIADRQLAGRGRLGRSFVSPGGMGLYYSYLVRPKERAEHNPAGGKTDWTTLTSRSALAACNAIARACGLRPRIKWVNDLYLPLRGETDGSIPGQDNPLSHLRKVCGILAQSAIANTADTPGGIVIGIGINVHETQEDFPPALRGIAASLDACSGETVSRALLAAALTQEMDALCDPRLTPHAKVLGRYRADSFLPGLDVFVIRGEEAVAAKVLGIEDDFSLRVLYADGSQECLHGSEVTIRFSAS